MAHEYLFKVEMHCEGCSNAVNRALGRLNGVENVDISLKDQSVRVKTADNLDYDNVFNTIKKTGKAIQEGETLS